MSSWSLQEPRWFRVNHLRMSIIIKTAWRFGTSNRRAHASVPWIPIKDTASGITFSDRDYTPFWTPYTGGVSRRLWLRTETGLHVSPWCSFLNKKESNSWFTVKTMKGVNLPNNSPKTFWQSQQSLWQAITENGGWRKKETQKGKGQRSERWRAKKDYNLPQTRKIRLYPKVVEMNTLFALFL